MKQIDIYNELLGAEMRYEIPEGVMDYIEQLETFLVILEEERDNQINTFYQN